MTNLAELPTGYALKSNVSPWTLISSTDRVPFDRGVAALVDGQQVAIFRLSPADGLPEEWYAVSHLDPATGAPVMARGLVGSREVDGEVVATLASPLHKRRYALATGRSLDDDSASLPTFEVLVADGQVLAR